MDAAAQISPSAVVLDSLGTGHLFKSKNKLAISDSYPPEVKLKR